MTNFRALCAELLEWAERTSSHYYKQADVIIRARTLLDQPEPVVPSDEELMDMAEFYIEDNGLLGLHNAGEFARAVLARWGSHD